MRKTSLRSRIAILFTLVVTIVLVLAAISFSYFCRLHFERKDTLVLESKASAIEQILATKELPSRHIAASISNIVENSYGITAVLMSEDRPIHASGDASDEIINSLNRLPGQRWALDVSGSQYSGITKSLDSTIGQDNVTAFLALDVTHRVHFFDMIMEWFFYTLFASALLSGILGFLLIKKGLKPIRSLSKTTSTITAKCLDTSVSTESIPEELHELVDNFNEMLVRLDESFVRLSGFSADIAHELRTPLNNMLTQYEVWLIKDRDKADYKEMLFSSLEELRRMSRMVDDMLFLAKSDNHLIIPNLGKADLAKLAASVVEYHEYLAEDKGLSFSLRGSAAALIDAPMLQRALSNIISNAIRYADPDSTITIELSAKNNISSIVVSNRGAEIPESHLARIFDRFYRVDSARREGSTNNAGLGMAITRSIIEAHRGRIFCNSAERLTSFSIYLPNKPDDATPQVERPCQN